MKFSRPRMLGALVATVALVMTGCSGAGSLTGGGGREITVAMVSNSQMQDAVALSDQFEEQNPGVSVKFVTLSENEARAKITASVATGGGEFDVVMISNYETPMWGEYGWLEVVDMSSRLGVFLDNGINKDLLVFVDDLPKLQDEWPRPGDRLLVTLKRDKLGRLLAKPVTEEEVVKIAQPADESMKNKQVAGTVYKVIQAGAFLLTEDDQILFIHRDEMTERLHLGQTIQCRVSFVREDGRMNGSMRERKEVKYGEDADKLLRYLLNRDGAMPYTDDTPADVIRDKFQMSKSSFKRALGKLMKERRIEQKDGWTKVIETD